MLFREYIRYWYETYRYPKHSVTTAMTTMNNLRNHIFPSDLGNMEVTDIRTKDVQVFLAELLLHGNKCPLPSMHCYGNPLSRWTVRKIRQMIISCLDQAVKEEIVTHNYARDTEPVPMPYTTVNPFSMEAQRKFLAATRNHRFYLAYVLLFYTGMRRGELLGLSWDNINWKGNFISVNQTLVVERGKAVLKKRHAKTGRSIRSIPIPREIKFMLKDQYNKQIKLSKTIPGWRNKENLVFVNEDGSHHHPNYFSKTMKDIIKRLGLPSDLHLHCTRHSWATNMVQCGVPISDIQSLGGWSKPEILLTIYAQSVQESHKKAINKLYKTFGEEMVNPS